MPRKKARPAAKKRAAKLADRIKAGRRPKRIYYDIETRGPDMSMGLAMAVLGAGEMDRMMRK